MINIEVRNFSVANFTDLYKLICNYHIVIVDISGISCHASQILHEILFGESKSSKIAVFAIFFGF